MESISAPLAGKVAIVTGGSRGIGASIAVTLARQGCSHIAITYSSAAAKAQAVLEEIHAISPKIKTTAFSADLADADFGKHVVQQALKGLEVDHIDIAISNAALVEVANFPKTATVTRDEWDAMQHGTCWAPLDLARRSVEVMPPGGRIILISSAASSMASGDPLTSYSVGKAGVEAVGRNLAAMYGPAHGVTVNSISVGATGTEALQTAVDTMPKEFGDKMNAFSLFNRIGKPQEIADIVAFVASPQASWMTGNLIPASGGPPRG